MRDVFRLHTYRLGLMLDREGPEFPNWDQDETAVVERYAEQDPDAVAWELLVAAAGNAELWDTVTPDRHARTGFRSDGAAFTVDSFARYFVHDVVHHVADVVRGNRILDSQRRT